jgi:peptidoglycan-associated lipoprotein
MRGQIKIILGVSAMLALGACEKGTIDSWTFGEAGSFLDEGGFGNPTMNNMLVQTGQKSYVVSLNERFAREIQPNINFEFNSSLLDAAARDTLRQQADWIKQFPEVRFKVFGHTDLVGSDSYNKRLGLRRARAAVSFLVSQGISRSRLEAVVSYGESRPVVVTDAPERRNRRTITEVSGFVKNAPQLLNGKYAEVVFREYIASAAPVSDLALYGSTTAE